MMATTVSQVRRGAKTLYQSCFVQGKLDDGRAREVVTQVLHSKRRGYLAVLSELKRLIRLERARHTAKIESAVPLQADLKASLLKNLQIAYGAELSTEFAQNPELIGGMRVRVANDVYDGSVRSRLAALARSFGVVDSDKPIR
jgi:F-type H+-transporting ATPase subunit delta